MRRIFVHWMSKIIFFLQKKVTKQYHIIWKGSKREWFDNTINYFNYFESPQSLERPSIAMFHTNYEDVCLDVGCGDGFAANLISRKAKKIYAIDISQEAIDVAKKRYQNKNIHFETIAISGINKFSDIKFDKIFSFSAIEFLTSSEIDLFFNFIKNNLNSNGLFIGSLNLSSKENLGYIKTVFETVPEIRDLLSIYFTSIEIKTTNWNKERTEVYFFCKI